MHFTTFHPINYDIKRRYRALSKSFLGYFIYFLFVLTMTFICFTALVAEVTQPSLGVGYEIGRAIENKKKILCLFRPDSGKCKLLVSYFNT